MTRKFIVHWGHLHRKLPAIPDPLADSADAQAWSPNTDVCERPDSIAVRMELAGVTVDRLEIVLEERALVVQGERRDPACAESAAGYRFRQLEIEYGPFRRVIPLPYPVDAEHAKARMHSGILEIRLPRAEGPTQTTVNVIVES